MTGDQKIEGQRWSAGRARTWSERRPWLCGFNYLPSTAVNSTEMWQQETFDLETIRRELGWAGEIGLNACRVFVQFRVWEADAGGLLPRLDQFLAVAHGNGLATLIILLDDCAFAGREPSLGPQDAPVPGVHNSGWTPSPGPALADDPAAWPRLERYVYNEPGNSRRLERSLPLLKASFAWARRAAPSQPLTSAVWAWDDAFWGINAFLLSESDVISFHDYNDAERSREIVAGLRQHGRPLLCTEWMARTLGSRFETHLPLFREEDVGCFFWGLVNGRTQTHLPWGSPEGALPPPLWFHDLLDSQGKPFRSEEIALIRRERSQAVPATA